MNVTFVTEKNDFDFCLVVEGKQEGAKPYFFNIKGDCDLKYEALADEEKVGFEFKLDPT